MKTYKRFLQNGVSFIEFNGVKLLVSTFAEVTQTYNIKDEFSSFDEYIEYKLMQFAYLAARYVARRKYSTLGTEFYEKLIRDLYIDYVRDCNPDGYCSTIRDLENTRDIINKELLKVKDDSLVFIRDGVTNTIDKLNTLFVDGDGDGNGHDLYMSAFMEIWRAYKKDGLMPFDTVTVNTKKGTKQVAVFVLAMRAVDRYIDALKRNFAAIENNTPDGDGDGDEKTEAVATVAYIEHAFDDYDDLKDKCQKYNLNERECLVVEYIGNGYTIKDVAAKIDRDEKTVYKIISQIRDKIQAYHA